MVMWYKKMCALKKTQNSKQKNKNVHFMLDGICMEVVFLNYLENVSVHIEKKTFVHIQILYSL